MQSHSTSEVSPNIQWKRPNMPYTPASIPDSANSRQFNTTLELNPLQSTDAGEYICQASYSLGGYTSPLVRDSLTLKVISKSLFNALFNLYFLIEQLQIHGLCTCNFPFDLIEPLDPVRPEDITFLGVKSDSVIIHWTVPYISYFPETYVVQYGTNRDSLRSCNCKIVDLLCQSLTQKINDFAITRL